MITLWDVEGGLPQLDKYLYSNDQAVVAGALLGVGIVNANVRVRHRLDCCCSFLPSAASCVTLVLTMRLINHDSLQHCKRVLQQQHLSTGTEIAQPSWCT